MLDQAVTMPGTECEQLVDFEADWALDKSVDRREGDESSAAPGHLHRAGASDLAETLDGDGPSLQPAKHSLGRGRDSEACEERVKRHAHVVREHQVGLVGARKRTEIVGYGAEVGGGQELRRLDQRPDLVDVSADGIIPVSGSGADGGLGAAEVDAK